MQIHAQSKGNVALDYITLWADRCTKCHENIISRFISSTWINIGSGKGSSSRIRQQSANTEASGPSAPRPWSFVLKINRLRHNVENYYYCAKFQVIPIRGFRFIVLTYRPTPLPTHTPIHMVTKWSQYRRRRSIYVVGADDQLFLRNLCELERFCSKVT